VEINYLVPVDALITADRCKQGQTYAAVPNGKSPYLCVYSMRHGRMLVALDSGTCYEPSAFPTTKFREIDCKALVNEAETTGDGSAER